MAKTKKGSLGMGVVCLLLNALVLPGLGSILTKRKEGVSQLVIAIISIPLVFVLVGFPLFIVVWIWGIISGFSAIRETI